MTDKLSERLRKIEQPAGVSFTFGPVGLLRLTKEIEKLEQDLAHATDCIETLTYGNEDLRQENERLRESLQGIIHIIENGRKISMYQTTIIKDIEFEANEALENSDE